MHDIYYHIQNFKKLKKSFNKGQIVKCQLLYYNIIRIIVCRINALVEQEVKRRLLEERVQREKQRRIEREKERLERDQELVKIKRAHEREIQRLKEKYESKSVYIYIKSKFKLTLFVHAHRIV